MGAPLGESGRAARLAIQMRAQQNRRRVQGSHQVIKVEPRMAAWGPAVDMSPGSAAWGAAAPFSERTTRAVQSIISSVAGLLLLFSPLAVAYQASLVTDAPRIIETQVVPGRDTATPENLTHPAFQP